MEFLVFYVIVAKNRRINSTYNCHLSSVSSLFRLTQGFANIDADLMSLLHLSPRSIFDVGAGDGTCSEVESLLAETRRFTRCVHALSVANALCSEW